MPGMTGRSTGSPAPVGKHSFNFVTPALLKKPYFYLHAARTTT